MRNNAINSLLYRLTLAGGLLCGWQVAAVQMIADRHFQTGATVQNAAGDPEGPMQYTTVYGAPVWRLSQWGSQSSIYGVSPAVQSSGSMLWENPDKALVLGPTNTEDSDIEMTVDSISEFGGVYRTANESWPALYIAQRISEPNGNFKATAPWISELSELDFHIETRLNYANNIYTNGYNPSLHCAHFQIFFTIQNLQKNPKNAGYGKDYLWFGISFYDDRKPLPGLTHQLDQGTGRWIYNIGIQPFCTNGMVLGQWKKIDGDLLPYIKAGLQDAWSQHYMTNSTNYADYKIGNMNIGWEVPGLSQVSMQVRNLGLQAYGLNFAKPYEFNTDGNADGWSCFNLTDQGAPGPTNGTWVLTASTNDPQLIGPSMRLNALLYKRVLIRMANAGNPAAASVAQLYWKRSSDTEFSDDRSVSVAVGNDGGWKEYVFDMHSCTNWSGEINQLRFDPVLYGDGHSVGVDYIRPSVDSISASNAPALGLNLVSGNRTLFWKSSPYQQYTLQCSTNLTSGLWLTVDGFSQKLPEDSLMQYSPVNINTSGRAFYRIDVSPGP